MTLKFEVSMVIIRYKYIIFSSISLRVQELKDIRFKFIDVKQVGQKFFTKNLNPSRVRSASLKEDLNSMY